MMVKRRFKTGTRYGSGVGSQDRPVLSDDRVKEIIREEMIKSIWGQFLEMIGAFKTVVVEYFYERYAAIAETAAAIASTAVTATGK